MMRQGWRVAFRSLMELVRCARPLRRRAHRCLALYKGRMPAALQPCWGCELAVPLYKRLKSPVDQHLRVCRSRIAALHDVLLNLGKRKAARGSAAGYWIVATSRVIGFTRMLTNVVLTFSRTPFCFPLMAFR
jgi:hypothetical protein